MSPLFPIVMLLATGRNQDQSKVVQSMLPAMLPMPPGPRVALAAVTATQQAQDARRAEAQLLSETVSAVHEQSSSAPLKISEGQLASRPKLAAVLAANPDIRAVFVKTGIASGAASREPASGGAAEGRGGKSPA